ncbi:hypothetical protein AB0K89_08345 [Streptomyces cinnamoneus]|uniref:hypothetical protein n=1 Tax=Streptomyces cinnamoneus TaxID=53446 RepID=UPI003427A5EC
MSGHPRIVVHPPSPAGGGRRVTVGAETLGHAHGLIDLLELLVKAGVGIDDARLEDTDMIDWRGGGPGMWS